jgi:methanogenic corrinoid protein MtbC1
VNDAVIRPALTAIGDRWARGEITPADEHLATEIVLRLRVLMRALGRAADRRGGGTVLLAAAEGERHIVGLAMAADLLDDAGYRVLYAGADVPVDSFGSLLERHRPGIVALTATMGDNVPALRVAARMAQGFGVSGVLAGGAAAAALGEGVRVTQLDGVAGVVSAADGLFQHARLN